MDLYGKRVFIQDLSILQFFYPNLSIVSDLKQPIDYSKGVIYTGLVTDSILKRLSVLTNSKYIIISNFAEIRLEKPSDYIHCFFPAIDKKAHLYSNYDMAEFLPILKQYYILQKTPPTLKLEETGAYKLFEATTLSKKELYDVYFRLIDSININYLASSIFTFLTRVKEKDFNVSSGKYKKLLNKANLKYGSKISSVIMQYISSDQKPEIALLELLDTLNG